MSLLKRKRSDSELSFSSASVMSSPPRPGAFDFTVMATDAGRQQHQRPGSGRDTPAHLPSRTLKRIRGGRPSDDEVHEHTLRLLYGAGQHSRHPEIIKNPAVEAPPTTMSVPVQSSPGQRSLHSFWKLPPSSTPSPAAVASLSPVCRPVSSSHCDDCGASLLDADGTMMDLDQCSGTVAEEQNSCCTACWRAVCDHCSVNNLEGLRSCLACAGRRVWIGGIGWTRDYESRGS